MPLRASPRSTPTSSSTTRSTCSPRSSPRNRCSKSGRHTHMADLDELLWLDATAQAGLVRQGEVKPAELVDAAIARVEATNPTINAVIHRRFDKARAEAAGDLPDGPFRGVPFVLKDLNCESEGDPA